MNREMLHALEADFPPDKVKQKRGQGGRMMNYISHGLVTERLNDVDPDWSTKVLEEHTYLDDSGVIHCAGVTLALTIGGVTRVESGGPQRQDGFANEIKNAYSDALKRASMRFGVALRMWETLIDAESDEDVVDQETGEIITARLRLPGGGQISTVGGSPNRPITINPGASQRVSDDDPAAGGRANTGQTNAIKKLCERQGLLKPNGGVDEAKINERVGREIDWDNLSHEDAGQIIVVLSGRTP